MKTIKIIMAIIAMAAATAANAQDEDFRLKWAENDGTEWNIKDLGKEKYCTLVSEVEDADYKVYVYAKLVVLPPDPTTMLFISDIDCEGVLSVFATIGEEKYIISDVKSKYADYAANPNMIGKDIAGIDRATILMFEDERVSKALRTAKKIKLFIKTSSQYKYLTFNFTTSHPME